MQRCDDQDLVIYYVIGSSFLNDRSPYAIGPLSVCPVCLSVTLVCCGQTVRWIKMKLGIKTRPHCVRWAPISLQSGGTAAPTFWSMYCGQTVAHLSYCWALVNSCKLLQTLWWAARSSWKWSFTFETMNVAFGLLYFSTPTAKRSSQYWWKG